jgi:hypothetical protein
MAWIDEVLAQHKELEAPVSFWYWGALASISAVLKDNVFLDRQLYKLYSNIYVMLHADSGLKKGPPISMAKQLVRGVNNTRIISGRSSIQGMLKEMGTSYTMPGGVVMNKAVAFICSSELSSSIVEDKVATTILTDLYDRHYNAGDWKSLLKMESFELKDPTITMFTATNAAHSDDFFQKKDIQGGYFARTFIIYESQRNKVNSLLAPLINKPDYNKLLPYLKEVAKLQGPFKPLASEKKDDYYYITRIKEDREIYYSEAGAYYEDWYENFTTNIDISKVKDETGTLNRFGDSVLKIAMLLSLARKPELIITTDTMIEAVQECEKLVGNVRKTTLGRSGKSEWAHHKVTLIHELLGRTNHTISRAQVNKKYWMDANSNQWDEIAKSMQDAGTIRIESMGNQVLYVMPEVVAKAWADHLAGKKEPKE